MLNKFFLDKDYTVQLLMNMQIPVSMNDQLWDNSILLEIDADDTLNQYFVVDNGIDTEVLNVTPGQVNVLQVTEVWWAYGGVTTITPYKNGQAISDKIIDITFPEVVDNAGMISSTEEDPEEMVLVGQHYEMSGSEYPEQAVQEIQQEVQDIQENKQDKLVAGSGISIDPTTNTISATGGGGGGGVNYSTTEQDTGLKWIDGKTVYQITVELEFERTAQQNVTYISKNIPGLSKVISITGVTIDRRGVEYSFPFARNGLSTESFYEHTSGTSIGFYNTFNTANAQKSYIKATILYVKAS